MAGSCSSSSADEVRHQSLPRITDTDSLRAIMSMSFLPPKRPGPPVGLSVAPPAMPPRSAPPAPPPDPRRLHQPPMSTGSSSGQPTKEDADPWLSESIQAGRNRHGSKTMHVPNVVQKQVDEDLQRERICNHDSMPLLSRACGVFKSETWGSEQSAMPQPLLLSVPDTASTRSPVRMLTVTHPNGSTKCRKRVSDVELRTLDGYCASRHQHKPPPKVSNNYAARTQGTTVAGTVWNVNGKKQERHSACFASSHRFPSVTHPSGKTWTTGDKSSSADDNNWSVKHKTCCTENRDWSSKESWGNIWQSQKRSRANESKSSEDWKDFTGMAWRSEDEKRSYETQGILPAAFGGPLVPEQMFVLPAPPIPPPMDRFSLPPSSLPPNELQVNKVPFVSSLPVTSCAKAGPCQAKSLLRTELQVGGVPSPPASPFQRQMSGPFTKRQQRVEPSATNVESSSQRFGDADSSGMCVPAVAPAKVSSPIFVPKPPSVPPPVEAYIQKAFSDSQKKRRRMESPVQRVSSTQRPAPPRGLLTPSAVGSVSPAVSCDTSAKNDDDVDEVLPTWLVEYLQESADNKTYTARQLTEWFKEHGIQSFWRYVPYDDKHIQGRCEPSMTAEVVADDPAFDLEPGTLVPISEELTCESTTYIKTAGPNTSAWFSVKRPCSDVDGGGRLFERVYGSR